MPPMNPVFLLESATHSNTTPEPRVGELRPVFNRHASLSPAFTCNRGSAGASPSRGVHLQSRLSRSFALPGRPPAIAAQQELRPPGAFTCNRGSAGLRPPGAFIRNHRSAGLRRDQSSRASFAPGVQLRSRLSRELRPPGIRKVRLVRGSGVI